MKTYNTTFDLRKSLIRVFGIPAVILMIPLIGMQMSNDMNWSFADFIIIGALLIGAGIVYEVASRIKSKHKIAIAILIVLGAVYLWTELAVGVFTNWGS